jgi:hypothetical protein
LKRKKWIVAPHVEASWRTLSTLILSCLCTIASVLQGKCDCKEIVKCLVLQNSSISVFAGYVFDVGY